MAELSELPFEITHDGDRLSGSVVSPTGRGPHPAILMFPGATGTGPSFRHNIRELASLGYLTIGIDMYGASADISTPQAAGAHFQALLDQPERLRARTMAWFEAVCARADVDEARVSAIGYCFGGKCTLELVRSGAKLLTATSFHGLLTTHAPAQPDTFAGYVAIWAAGRDPFAPLQDLDALRLELKNAKIDFQSTIFENAQHSFTDPDHDGVAAGIEYSQRAHHISWHGTLALLRDSLAATVA